MNKNKDTLYATPMKSLENFQFDQQVVNVFPDMIQRSVPGYADIISALSLIADCYAQNDSNIYDLGCSLGAASFSMSKFLQHRQCKIIAVDKSEAMIQQLEKKLLTEQLAVPIELICEDICNVAIQNASIVVLNFTLQFIPLANRNHFINDIYHGMKPGAVLVLSEKIQFPDNWQQTVQTQLHHRFKKAHGYSDLEISQKRTALENVLLTESFHTHQQRLLQAGFKSVETWFQFFNFCSIIAIK